MANIKPIEVEYIDHMGSDKRVTNVARVSFNKWEDESNDITTRDSGLISYLATGLPSSERDNWELRANAHTHWSPFAHCFLSVRCSAPIFLARQLVKHQVGLSWNEESRRYISDEVDFWLPEAVHEKPSNAKQGSGKVMPDSAQMRAIMKDETECAYSTYKALLSYGVAPEEARMVLPLNSMTHWVWSGSLMAFMRVYSQRIDGHAQLAAQEFAGKLGGILKGYFPESFKQLGGI